MAKYQQIIPPFIIYKEEELETGEIVDFCELFSKPFIKRHIDYDRSTLLKFRTAPQNSVVFCVIIWIEYPNAPAMSHAIGKLFMTSHERVNHQAFLDTIHPLAMQKIYEYLLPTEKEIPVANTKPKNKSKTQIRKEVI